MGATELISGNNSASDNTTRYYPLGSGAPDSEQTTLALAEIVTRTALTLGDLVINIGGNSTPSSNFIVFKGSASTTLSISIGDSVTGFLRDSSTVSVSAGDDLAYRIFAAFGGSGITIAAVHLKCLADSGSIQIMVAAQEALADLDLSSASSTTYSFIQGGIVADATQNNSKVKFHTEGTMKNGFVYVSANARTTATTLTLRINGADGNIVVSMTGSTTGRFEDTSNTDTISDGDDLNWKWVTGTGTETITIETAKIEFAGAGSGDVQMNATTVPSNDNLKRWKVLAGDNTGDTIEAEGEGEYTIDKILENLFIRVVLSTTVTVTLRRNSANTDLSISIASSSGVFEDTADQVSITDGDDVSYEVDVTGFVAMDCIKVEGITAGLVQVIPLETLNLTEPSNRHISIVKVFGGKYRVGSGGTSGGAA